MSEGGFMGEGETQDFLVALDGVHLTLGHRSIFRALSCGFPRGKVSVVLGGSGSGKSTLLRMIGGLQRPDSGSVRLADRDITQLSERELYKIRNRVGMLFQGGALVDSMTVFENAALPLCEHTSLSESDIDAEVNRRLSAVGLSEAADLYPRQLSGGMVRRAALARAIVMDPEILLVDEPFSGLDPINVRRIEALLCELNRKLSLTLIVTSHHMASALRMADRLVFMVDGGAISGPTRDMLDSDDTRVAEFLKADSDPNYERRELEVTDPLVDPEKT
jgi:phospholipid/cholesterol/gamma-HCH transport system ATP-binding protein